MRSPGESYRPLTDRIVAGILISLFFGILVGYLWWGRFEYHKSIWLAFTYFGAIATVLFGHLYFRDQRKKLGIRLDNFFEALKTAAIPNLLLLAIMLIWGVLTRGLSADWSHSILIYLPWALLQQYILQNFLLARLCTILGKATLATVTAALLFALIHLPNAGLVVTSLVGALVWCKIFLKVPTLLVVSLSHALLGMLLVVFFKFSGFDQLHVGKPGFAYRSFGDGVLVASGYDGSGQPFVATLPGHDLGNPSLLRVFDPSGQMRSEWVAFPDYDFSGNLAVGELGFEAGDEIVVSPGPGVRNPPEIAVFNISGREMNRFTLEQYHGYGAAVSIAEGRILVSPGPGPNRSARFFEYMPDGSLIKEWDFGEIGFHNSVRAQRLESRGEGGQVRTSALLLWANALSVNSSEIHVYNESNHTFSTWESYGTDFGLNLSLIKLGKDRMGIVTGPGSAPGHTPRIKVFDESGRELQSLFVYEDDSPCGTNVSALDLDGDSTDEIVLGEGMCPGQPSIVRIVDRQGKLISQWEAY